MKMKKAIIFLSFLTLPFLGQSQHFELGILAGASNYMGDLAPSNFWTSFGETHASVGVFGRYNINNWVAVKGNFQYGRISAHDSNSKDIGRLRRNLSFQSDIMEFGIQGEINILGYQPYNLERVISPYVFVGIAMFKFNPKAEYQNEWYDLQPLGTEGQGQNGVAKYSLTQFAVPVGFGLKYAINDMWNIGLEFGMRKTFTDYLDDVSGNYPDLSTLDGIAAELSWRGDEYDPDANPPSTDWVRGDSGDKDWYLIGGVFISYNFLDNGLVGSRGRSRRKSGCPTF